MAVPQHQTHLLATVRMHGCALYLPLESAYDRDLLFEHLNNVARAHYRAHLVILERSLLTSECGRQACGCAECGRVMGRGAVQHRTHDHTLCTYCARHLVDELNQGAP
jgi:hypothetical protein